jgi:hypothetical protein
MLTIGGAPKEVVVRRVVERARVQAPVVALLELDRIDAAPRAARISALAFSTSPWWLWPISAMT